MRKILLSTLVYFCFSFTLQAQQVDISTISEKEVVDASVKVITESTSPNVSVAPLVGTEGENTLIGKAINPVELPIVQTTPLTLENNFVANLPRDVQKEQTLINLYKNVIYAPALIDLTKDFKFEKDFVITSIEGGYEIEVPQASFFVGEEKISFPAQKSVLSMVESNGLTYQIMWNDLSGYKPLLGYLANRSNIKMDTFQAQVDLNPSLNFITKESASSSNIVFSGVSEAQKNSELLSIKGISAESSITPDLVRKELGYLAEYKIDRLKVISPYGEVSFDNMFSFVQCSNIPIDIWEAWMKMNPSIVPALNAIFSFKISKLKIDSVFVPLSKIVSDIEFFINTVKINTYGDISLDARLIWDITKEGSTPIKLIPDTLLPKKIVANINISGVKGALVTELIALQKKDKEVNDSLAKVQEINGEQVTTSMSQGQKEEEIARKLLETLQLTINELYIENDNWDVSLEGIFKGRNLSFRGPLTITNFDFLSKETEKFMAQTNPDGTVTQSPSLLEVLRPYLASERRGKNAKGLPMDTFELQASNEGFLINGYLFGEPINDEKKQSSEQQELAPVVDDASPKKE